MMDERQGDLSAGEIEAKIAARKRAELTLYGGAAVGAVGCIVILMAAWRENIMLTVAGAMIALVAFGVMSAAQAGKLFGRGG